MNDLTEGELPEAVESRIEEAAEAIEGDDTAANEPEGDEQAPA